MAIPPLKLSEEVEKRLLRWLVDELTLAEFEFADRDEKALKYERMYDAEPERKIKTFPWYKASNLVAPLAGIMVDAIYSRLMNTLWGVEPFWSVRARSAEWVELAENVQRFLEWVQEERLGLYAVMRHWVMETIKVGLGAFNLPWRTVRKRYPQEGGGVRERVVYDGPAIEPIPWTDLYYRGLPRVIEDPLWCGYRVRMGWEELKRWEACGYLHDVERVKSTAKAYYSEIEQHRAETQQRQPITPEHYELYIIQCGFDIDGDGVTEELVVVVSKDAPALLRVDGNRYEHGERTLHLGTYFPREHSLAGVGVMHMLEPLQDAMTTLLNQTIDNATSANTLLLKVRKGCGVKQGTRIYPMKVIELDDPERDVIGMRFGEVYPSSFNLIAMMRDMAERRVGVSDYNLGRESPIVSYAATATSTLALLQESGRRFDTTLREMRYVMRKVGMQVLQLYAQFKPKGADYEVLGEEGKYWMKQLLRFPAGMMRDKVTLEVTAASTAHSRPIEQQSLVSLFGLITTFYTRMVEGLELATSPQVPAAVREFAEEAAKGASELMRRTLKAFDMKDAERFLPDLDAIFAMELMTQAVRTQTPTGEQGGGVGGGVGGAGTAAGGPGRVAQQPWMEGV